MFLKSCGEMFVGEGDERESVWGGRGRGKGLEETKRWSIGGK